MKAGIVHDWTLSAADARDRQTRLASSVETRDRLPDIRHVGGTDVAFPDGGKTTLAAVVVMTYPSLEVVDHAVVRQPTRFPYVPGLLSFREVPALLDAVGELNILPDLFLCDGQGIAHPRRLGLASHLGLWLDTPTIGVAKSRLCGTHREPGMNRGNKTRLMMDDEQIGWVLRTRRNVKPLFISPGHRVGLETAARIVLRCAPRFRLPEPTRLADRLAAGRPLP